MLWYGVVLGPCFFVLMLEQCVCYLEQKAVKSVMVGRYLYECTLSPSYQTQSQVSYYHHHLPSY